MISSGGRTGIAIRGSGIVTAAGRGPERTLAALAAGGRSPGAPRTIRSELADRHPVFEVPDDALARAGARLPGGRGRRGLRLAVAAACDAMRECGPLGVAPERFGVVVGGTVGGMNYGEQWIEESFRAPGAETPRRVPARPAIRHLPLWEVPNVLAEQFGLAGPTLAVSTACTSGAQSIATAGDLIATGICDAVLAGGVDCLARITYHGFAALGVMSQRRSTPFDANRSGLNLGEGAAFVVLVRADLAPAGGPRLAGWGSNTDAHHMTAPRPDGSGVAAAMRSALELARVAPRDVGWVHAHGTGTTTNDTVESTAVRAVFGAHRVPVSSTKHVFGHTLGAAGAVGAVVALLSLREGFVPGNAPIETRDATCDVDVVPPEGLRTQPRYALVGSLGFGGANCALLLAGGAA